MIRVRRHPILAINAEAGSRAAPPRASQAAAGDTAARAGASASVSGDELGEAARVSRRRGACRSG